MNIYCNSLSKEMIEEIESFPLNGEGKEETHIYCTSITEGLEKVKELAPTEGEQITLPPGVYDM